MKLFLNILFYVLGIGLPITIILVAFFKNRKRESTEWIKKNH